MKRLVTLLTDFGLQDSYVAEVKGVLLSAHPDLTLVDITHEVPPYNVELGAFQLLRSYRQFPKGTLHLGVVDPGVGTARRAIYIRTKEYHFVGPDNGLLLWAVRDAEARDGTLARSFEIPVSKTAGPTFHGRDVFAPFAARVLKKVPAKLSKIERLEGREFPGFEKRGAEVTGEIVAYDHFGNTITSIPLALGEPSEGRVDGMDIRLKPATSYQAIPQDSAALIAGSHGFWEVSCREASAKEKLGLRTRTRLTLRFSTPY